MGQGNPFCTPGNYTALWTPQTCATQGIGLFGGNPHLTPETSQNFNYGIVLSPVEDLGITLDFYRILVKNAIGGVPASAIYANPTLFSSYIVPATTGQYQGTLTPSIAEANSCVPLSSNCGYIKLLGSNTGGLTTDGIDISVLYAQHTSIGTFSEDLEGTAVTQFLEQQYTGGPTLNLVGWYNTLAPAYRWQHNLRANWTSPGTMFGVGVGNRFYSRYIDEFPDGNGNQRNVGSYSLWDVYGSYKPLSYLTVLLGVKNVFNTSPPLTNASQGNFAAGYNSFTADPLLRNFYLNVKLSF